MSKFADQRRQCTSKIPYASRREALTQIRNARSGRRKHSVNTPTSQHQPYQCPWCGLWHVGRKSKPHRKYRKPGGNGE